MFDRKAFSIPAVFNMNQQFEKHDRHMVVITDPHIKADTDNPVYAKANKANFVQDCTHNIFIGNCWPGQSAWIDFFNE
jgi:alpha-glucosidase (family GH31 glycosyl hydrolase)